jgi:glycosyltransferase involved in cell wall biosynthesis
MHRFFEPIIRPLLEVVGPSAVVEIGSDRGFGTELLAQWCQDHEAVLHSVDPLPKYDVAEWLARWPETLRLHRDLSLNALVDIGPVDFACIDGDHNWYTIFHELEMLSKSARSSNQPFPTTVLHDVGWPYGRRDLYYDPETIPNAFRHPHRKGGIEFGHRGLADHGFNDHLENAIHEGTPRNGVLTAIEDFIANQNGAVMLHVLPGLHGLGIVLDSNSRPQVHEAVTKLFEQESLIRVIEAVEADRIGRLEQVSKTQRRMLREERKVHELREVAEDRRKRLSEADRELRDAIKAKTAAEEKAIRAEEQAKEAEKWYRESVVQHHEERRVLGQQASKLQRSLERETTARLRRETDLIRLRNRRAVRVALAIAGMAKPMFRVVRGRGDTTQVRSGVDEATLTGTGPIDASAQPPVIDEDAAERIFEGSPLRSGLFYGLIRDVVSQGVSPEFVDDWTASESHEEPAHAGPELPLVSIVMPTHDRATLIGEAITSVLEQTYENWELLICDDGSTDGTSEVVGRFLDPRINYTELAWGGAARARNFGLSEATGEVIAYLDSDNLWHPRFLENMVTALGPGKGQYAAYCKFIDLVVSERKLRVKSFESRPFDYESLTTKNFIDLNSFVHRRSLYDHLGGFDERLVRQQDWDLILRYSFLRDPVYVDRFLTLYRRSDAWNQITKVYRRDKSSPQLIQSKLGQTYERGLTMAHGRDLPSVTVVSWDICRNHFSKAYNVAEAMASETQVQLVGFRFFDEPIFPPYANAEPDFETLFLPGGAFPDWNQHLAKAVANLSGDVIYAVKPRLPSLGAALLANYQFGTPVVVEINDLESVVNHPWRGAELSTVHLSEVDPSDAQLLNPHSDLWTQIMEGLVTEIPIRVTHNSELDRHFGDGAFFVRNPKNEAYYDPDRLDREAIRSRLGFSRDDRVILFGGMVRRHKGVFQLLDLLQDRGSRYRLVVVGSRASPDLQELRAHANDRVTILDPVDRNQMAEINLASDGVVLWLDPDVLASRYQMPFKLTDALAMKVPVVANDVGDLGEMARQGYVRQVPFGRTDLLREALDGLFEDREATHNMVEAGRRVYLRQFSYNAVRRNLEIIMGEAIAAAGTLPVAKEFAEFFSEFQEHIRAGGAYLDAESIEPAT